MLNDEANRMFFEFARMEYALKASGYLKQQDGPAEADWAAFSNEIDPLFGEVVAANEALRSAAEGLCSQPPRKQVVRKGVLGWADGKPDAKSETELLFKYIARVRNNLFHGGKFGANWLDEDRSSFLIPKCLLILSASRDLSLRVQKAYMS